MSLIPEVKCRRCGETFSSLRSRCPNCGTRRVSQSSRTPGATPGTVHGTAAYDRAAANTKWQMIFGLILVVAVILAVIVMVSTSLNGDGSNSNKPAKNTQAVETDTMPTPEAPPTPTPSPTPNVSKVELHATWTTDPWKGDEFTMESTSEDVVVVADVYPLDIQNPEITWSVEDDSIIKITPDPDDAKRCTVSYVGPGHGKLICKAFGYTKELTIYCR